MSGDQVERSDGEGRLGEAMLACLEALDAGREPDRAGLLARYPECAEALAQFLDDQQQVEQRAAPLRNAVRPRLPAAERDLTELGDFRIVREIGRGGMGVVYEAEQVSLGRRVALKVLPLAGALDPRQLQRFLNEARAAACLHHTNIVPVFGVGCERGTHYYAMQLIEGRTLAELIQELRQPGRPAAQEEGPGTVAYVPAPPGPAASTAARAALSTEGAARGAGFFRKAAELGAQAAAALDYAHQMGVVHRDVKPANLMLDARGAVWVADFGLAQFRQGDGGLTQTGDLVGTLRYMSPEQALAQRVGIDHRTDVYSLGATLYELLTLRPVFAGADRQELLRQIAFDEPRRPRLLERAVPAELETIVLKALEKNPADRYGTAQELADDLGRFLNDEPIRARRPSLLQRARKWARRHRAAVGAAAVCLAVSLAALAGSLGWALGEKRARQRDAEARVLEALEEAAPGLEQGNPHDPTLIAAAERARAQLDAGAVGPGLRDRVQHLLRDWGMLESLETARLQKVAGSRETGFDFAGADELYARAFGRYGLDVAALGAEQAAGRIRSSAIRTHLVAALDDWAAVRDNLRRGGGAPLSALAGLADDDPWRKQLRGARDRGDRAALEKLAEAPGAACQSPANLALLAGALWGAHSPAAAERLLRRAQTEQPADFHLNFNLAVTLSERARPDPAQAVRFYQAALALRPRSPVVYTNLGKAFYQQGKLAEAEAAVRKAIALKPDFAGAYQGLSVALEAQGKLAEAEAAARTAIALQPDFAGAHNSLGVALDEQGKLAEAEAAARTAIALQPDFAKAHSNLGRALGKQGRLAEAEKSFRKAITLKPDHSPAYIYIGLGNVLKGQGKQAEAQAAYRKAIQIEPTSADAHVNLGSLLADRGKHAEAEAAYRKAIQLIPDCGPAHILHYNLGLALSNQGKLAGAEAAFRKAIQLQPDLAEAHSDLGVVLYAQGKLAEAEAAYRKAIQLKPDYTIAHTNLGNALRAQGRLAEAEAAHRKAIQLEPTYAEAHNNLGSVLRAQGKAAEAEAAWRKAIELEPGYAMPHYNLGLALSDQGKLAGAEAACRKAITLQPGLAAAHDCLGTVLFNQGKLAEAETAYRKAVQLKPDFALAHFNLGCTLQGRRKLTEAETAFRKAIALKPDLAGAHTNLGNALRDQGKHAEAEAAFRKAIQFEPTYADAHRALGLALLEQGKLVEAEAALRKALTLTRARKAAATRKHTGKK